MRYCIKCNKIETMCGCKSPTIVNNTTINSEQSGKDGLSAKEIIINLGKLPEGATDLQFENYIKGPKGDKGDKGLDGKSDSGLVEVRFTKNTSVTDAPVINKTDRSPTGWVTGGITANPNEFVWSSQAVINLKDNSLFRNWTEPSRVSGIPGSTGNTGADGLSIYKSTVFIKTTDGAAPATPTGGSYFSPVPSTVGWSDGVPSGNGILYMSTRIFTSNGLSPQQSNWTTPAIASDSSDIDIEWSTLSVNPGNPTTNPSNWSNTSTVASIFMAIRIKSNGIWGNWDVSKIKGENGANGLDGTNGNNGKDAIYLDLSNENASVPTTFEGAVVGTIPSTKATVYIGNQISTGWLYYAVFNNCTGTIDINTGVVNITTITADSASVLITASKSTFSSLTSTYNLTKVRPGNPGEDAVIYYILPSENFIKVNNTGVVNPSTITCSKYKKVGNHEPEVTSEMILKYSIDDASEVNYSTGITILNTYNKISFRLYDTSNRLLDSETVLIIKDGNTGNNGDSTETMYIITERGATPPSLTSSGWSPTVPFANSTQTIWSKQRIKYGNGSYSEWVGPIKMTGDDGTSIQGPSMAYRGDWSNLKTYSGTEFVVDVIKYNVNGYGYIAKPNVGNIPAGTLPTNTTYWREFTSNIDSIFTDFLFAYKGYIQDLTVNSLKTQTEGTRMEITPISNSLKFYKDADNAPKVEFGLINIQKSDNSYDPPVLVNTPGIISNNNFTLSEYGFRVLNNGRATYAQPFNERLEENINVQGNILGKIVAIDSTLPANTYDIAAGKILMLGANYVNKTKRITGAQPYTLNKIVPGFTGVINGAQFVNGICVGAESDPF